MKRKPDPSDLSNALRGNSWLSSAILTQRTKVETWEDILHILQQYNYTFDFITIAHHSPKFDFSFLQELARFFRQTNSLIEYNLPALTGTGQLIN